MDGKDNQTITFRAEDGTDVEFSVVSETRFNGKNYVLVTEPEGEEAFLLRESADEDSDVLYEMVEDDTEIDAVGEIFRAILTDIDLI